MEISEAVAEEVSTTTEALIKDHSLEEEQEKKRLTIHHR